MAEGVVDTAPEVQKKCEVLRLVAGTGEAGIEANRLLGIRTAVYYGGPIEIVKLAREHNDANILSLGARFIDLEQAKEAVKVFLETLGCREHIRRIVKLDN
ncbi:MAG: RpiB/LacA/LacB family sugar-phosphate isomerase [Candidatus Paceibacterota bacterium]